MNINDFIAKVKGSLIVSCQALPYFPLAQPEILAALAKSVELGGAVAIRAEGSENIAAIRRITRLPIIGLCKTANRTETYITPTFEHARQIVEAGSDVIAVQATIPRLGNCAKLIDLISWIHSELGLGVMADISNLTEAEQAMAAGADLVATTLSGYTPHTKTRKKPDLDLVAEIAAQGIPVIAEGNYQTPSQVKEALNCGALAVVVGAAITMPDRITARFVEEIKAKR